MRMDDMRLFAQLNQQRLHQATGNGIMTATQTAYTLLILATAIAGCSSENKPTPPQVAPKPPAKQTATPKSPSADPPAAVTTGNKFQVSKETTYFTEPLRPDGRVDYVQALNRHAKQGVTIHNNTLVPLVKVFGPDFYNSPQRGEFFLRLGVPKPPKFGLYFIDERTFAAKQPIATRFEYTLALERERDIGTKEIWFSGDLPHLAAWLHANKLQLNRIRAALEKTHFYYPLLVSSSDGPDSMLMAAIVLPIANHTRSVCRALMARAMLALSQSRPDDAIADLVAAHRLARFTTSGQTMIETLVGVAVEKLVCEAGTRLLQSGTLTDPQLAQYEKSLEHLPRWPPAAESINVTERCLMLDAICYIARDDESKRELVDLLGSGIVDDKEEFMKAVGVVDWHIVLRTANESFDQLYAAAIEPKYMQRRAALDTFGEQLRQAGEVAKEKLKQLTSSESVDEKETSQAIADYLISFLASAHASAVDAQDRTATQLRLLYVAIQLERYRLANGQFPEKMDQLISAAGRELPIDLYTEKPFNYQRSESGYLLYSIGPNLQDDGGKTQSSSPRGDDLAVRMSLLRSR